MDFPFFCVCYSCVVHVAVQMALWRFKPNSLPFVKLAALKRRNLPAEEKKAAHGLIAPQ